MNTRAYAELQALAYKKRWDWKVRQAIKGEAVEHEPECYVHTEDGCMGPLDLAYERGQRHALANSTHAYAYEAGIRYERERAVQRVENMRGRPWLYANEVINAIKGGSDE
jgi:hypothetical protein